MIESTVLSIGISNFKNYNQNRLLEIFLRQSMARIKKVPMKRNIKKSKITSGSGKMMARKTALFADNNWENAEKVDLRANTWSRMSRSQSNQKQTSPPKLKRCLRLKSSGFNNYSNSPTEGVTRRIGIKKDIKIKRFSKFSISNKAFQRIVRDTVFEFKPDFRIQREALFALQTICEEFLIGLFHDAQLCTLHAGRKTLMMKDIDLTMRLKGLHHLLSEC